LPGRQKKLVGALPTSEAEAIDDASSGMSSLCIDTPEKALG